MEKLYFASRRHHAGTGIHAEHTELRAKTRVVSRTSIGISAACLLGLSSPMLTPQANAQESVVQKELNRRINNARKAQELLKTGDAAYQKGDYAKAVQDYAEAFKLLPPGSMSQQVRLVTAERYATAATEQARQLSRIGDYDKARNLLNTVLSPQIAPAHKGALKMLGKIDDPIRNNPALTPGHTKNIQKVGRLLREAEGFYSLGQHDRAATVYYEVLQIDRFNKAARRGIETIQAATPSTPTPLGPGITGNPLELAPDIREKLAGITVEIVNLDNATLEEAVDFIRVQNRRPDPQ